MGMADELNEKKAFLTWEESAAVLQTDARQGVARAQRLLAMRYPCAAVACLRMRPSPFIGCSSPHNKILPWHSAVWASFTKTARVLRWTLP
jgi:hypothetical protein